MQLDVILWDERNRPVHQVIVWFLTVKCQMDLNIIIYVEGLPYTYQRYDLSLFDLGTDQRWAYKM